MRLVVILTLGLGVWGPTLIDAEKIVFVVPRYVRRSYTSSPIQFRNHGAEQSYKMPNSVRGPKRPYFTGHDYGHASPPSNEPFFPNEKHRIPAQGGLEDFEKGFFTPKEQVNHVIIPHGKGISHGISFGKGYIPHGGFKGGNEHFEFSGENVNNLEYAGQSHQRDVGFEDHDSYSRFQNQDDQGPTAGAQNVDWPYPTHQSSYEQEANQEQVGLQGQDAYVGQETPSAPREEIFFPKSMGGEEQRGVPEENGPLARVSGNTGPTSGAPVATVERKLTPIILRDEVDMREYVEKVEAFAKSWPPTGALQGFGWQNQVLHPPGLTIPNFQGFNSWPRTPGGSYQVKEDSVEEPSQRSYRRVTM